jgi:hypothetical protein
VSLPYRCVDRGRRGDKPVESVLAALIRKRLDVLVRDAHFFPRTAEARRLRRAVRVAQVDAEEDEVADVEGQRRNPGDAGSEHEAATMDPEWRDRAAVRLVVTVDVPSLLLGLGCRQQGRAERDGAALNPEDVIALLCDHPNSLSVVERVGVVPAAVLLDLDSVELLALNAARRNLRPLRRHRISSQPDFDDVRASRDESCLGIIGALHVDVVPIIISGCKEESGEARNCIVGMQSTGAALSEPLGEITVPPLCRKLRRDEFGGSSLGGESGALSISDDMSYGSTKKTYSRK